MGKKYHSETYELSFCRKWVKTNGNQVIAYKSDLFLFIDGEDTNMIKLSGIQWVLAAILDISTSKKAAESLLSFRITHFK